MSNKKHARRVELKLTFENVKIPGNINKYVTAASYTDEEEDNADDFQIDIDDREKKMLGDWLEVAPIKLGQEKETDIVKKTQPETVINYVVQRGDTAESIALKYLGSEKKTSQIAQENNIKNLKTIYPGQVLKITTGGYIGQEVIKKKPDGNPRLLSAKIIQKNWNGTGKDITLDCGIFEIDNISVSGPPTKVKIKSTSIPYTSTLRMERKTRAWENTTLKAIGEQIAKDCGLKLLYDAEESVSYKRKEQIHTSDIKFLQELCKAAGMSLKVTALNIVIYSAKEYDQKPAERTFKYGDRNIISYKLSTSLNDTAYTSCKVSYTNPENKETIEATYTPDSTIGTGQVLSINERVSSTEEAMKLAQERLREKNTQEFTASLKVAGDVRLVAGITVKLKGFQEFDKKYKVTQAKHNLTGGYTVDLKLKQTLEGY